MDVQRGEKNNIDLKDLILTYWEAVVLKTGSRKRVMLKDVKEILGLQII